MYQDPQANPEALGEKAPEQKEVDAAQAAKAAEWAEAMQDIKTPEPDWSTLDPDAPPNSAANTEKVVVTGDTPTEATFNEQLATGGIVKLDNVRDKVEGDYIDGALEQASAKEEARGDIEASINGRLTQEGETLDQPPFTPDGEHNYAQDVYEATKNSVTVITAAEAEATDAIANHQLDTQLSSIQSKLDQAAMLVEIALGKASQTDNLEIAETARRTADEVNRKIDEINDAISQAQAADAEAPAYAEMLKENNNTTAELFNPTPRTLEEAVSQAQEDIIATAAKTEHADEAALRAATGE